jgi:hypothetical protein
MVFMLGMDRRWAGFYVDLSRTGLRICLGFVAFTIMPISDYELLEALLDKYTNELESMTLDVDILDELDLH